MMENVIGTYKILREIGKGGMGIVYKALDPETQKYVAIKILPSSMVDSSMVERFNREAQALLRLKHPNIVEAYSVGMTKGQHYFAMEYVEGDTLKNVIKAKGALPVQDAVNILRQIASALSYAHEEEGISHRDIKPDNILVTRDGVVKVMDFGLVQIPGLTRVTKEGAAVGTPEYMSPEQVSDDLVDTRTDIYSFGVTMYEMLTGTPPFKGENFQATLMKHKYEKVPSIRMAHPLVPEELERIVNKAMAKDVAMRYQKVLELISDIDRLKHDMPGMLTNVSKVPKDSTIVMTTVGMSAAPTEVSRKRSYARAGQDRQASPFFFLIVFFLIAGCLGYSFQSQITTAISQLLSTRVSMLKEGDLTDETNRQLKGLEAAEKFYQRGLSSLRNNRLNDAIREFEKATELRGDYPLYYKDLAVALETAGETKRAIKAWQNVLQLSSSGSFVSTANEHINNLTK